MPAKQLSKWWPPQCRGGALPSDSERVWVNNGWRRGEVGETLIYLRYSEDSALPDPVFDTRGRSVDEGYKR